MSKSETCVAQDEKLDAPIRLTPDQLESVAAGFMAQLPHGGLPTIYQLPIGPRGPKGGPMGFAPVRFFS